MIPLLPVSAVVGSQLGTFGAQLVVLDAVVAAGGCGCGAAGEGASVGDVAGAQLDKTIPASISTTINM